MTNPASSHSYCIILAGGVGRRLWPVSRAARPKQFLDLLGVGRTLLQLTFDRFAAFLPTDHIFVSTFTEYAPLVREQLPDLPEEHILAEPVQLSTGPAAAWASWRIAHKDPEACLIATPADQVIMGEAAFEREVQAAFDFVRRNECFLAMSVPAAAPVTAYGYIQRGEPLSDCHYQVKSFTEKPPKTFAETFVKSGEFLWNTGIFLWQAATMHHELARILPDAIHIDTAAISNEQERHFFEQHYPMAAFCTLESLALDSACPTVVQACTFGWRDVGSWPMMHQVLHPDADGNACLGSQHVILQDTKDSLIVLPEGMAAVVRSLDGYLVAMEHNMLVITPNDDAARPRLLASEVQISLGEEFL